MPSAQGAVVAKALQRVVDQIPVMPAELTMGYIEARRADALLALCSQRIAGDADADRATVVVHASLEALAGRRNVETEHGAVMPPEALQRLACDARVQVIAETDAGDAVAFGRARREPSASMMRQLRHRDRGCRFPGCGSTAFANAHHIVWWSRGGTTDLENLVLICGFHHRLVHEHGWTIERTADGEPRERLATRSRPVRTRRDGVGRLLGAPTPPRSGKMGPCKPTLGRTVTCTNRTSGGGAEPSPPSSWIGSGAYPAGRRRPDVGCGCRRALRTTILVRARPAEVPRHRWRPRGS